MLHAADEHAVRHLARREEAHLAVDHMFDSIRCATRRESPGGRCGREARRLLSTDVGGLAPQPRAPAVLCATPNSRCTRQEENRHLGGEAPEAGGDLPQGVCVSVCVGAVVDSTARTTSRRRTTRPCASQRLGRPSSPAQIQKRRLANLETLRALQAEEAQLREESQW